MAASEVDAFHWIQSTGVLRDAASVTLVASDDADRVVRGFGGDLGRGRRSRLADIGMPLADQPLIAVRNLGSWLLVIEINGWQGSRPEVLRRVSAGSRAVSAYWNVNAVTRFSYASAGRMLTAFEAMSPGRRDGDDPDSLQELSAGLPWESGEWVPLMLALMARVTGIKAVPEWLDEEYDVVPISPVDDDPATTVNPGTEALTYDDAPLAWALLHADDAARARVAAQAARYATSQARQAGQADNFWAKAAAREAGSQNALASAFKSVTEARTCLQSLNMPEEEFRAQLMAELGNPPPPAGSLGLTAMAGPAPTDKYLWTSAHWLAPAGALRFARRAGLSEFADVLGLDTDNANDSVLELSRNVVGLRRVGDWLVAVEPPGVTYTSMSMPDGLITVHVTWSARGRNWIRYMTGDTLVAALDPQRPDQRLGDDPGFFDSYMSGLPVPFPSAGYAATQLPVMLAIAERLTGLVFTPEWLDETHVLMAVRSHDR